MAKVAKKVIKRRREKKTIEKAQYTSAQRLTILLLPLPMLREMLFLGHPQESLASRAQENPLPSQLRWLPKQQQRLQWSTV